MKGIKRYQILDLKSIICIPQSAILCFMFFILLSTDCISQNIIVKPPAPSNPVRIIAILPMVNNTNSVDGPQFVREQFAERLPFYRYMVKPIKNVDAVLKDKMGITLGSQLEMTTPQELGNILEADAVIYGTLMDFNTRITGFQNIKEVRAKFKMVDAKTGAVIWENGIGVRNEIKSGDIGEILSTIEAMTEKTQKEEVPWVEILSRREDDIGKALAMVLSEKIVSQASGKPLALEVNQMLVIILNGYYHLPPRRSAPPPPRRGGPPPPRRDVIPPPIPYGKPIPAGPMP